MNKHIKSAIIIVLIFSMVAILTTFAMITNSTQNVINNEESQNTNVIETGIDLYGTYNQNDLIIKDLIETFSGDEIKIPQIDGLKNKSIQEKINKEIYDSCFEFLNNIEIIDDGTQTDIENFDSEIIEQPTYQTSYEVMANFSNVISINYIVNMSNNFKRVHFNYNLVTGEKLKFEDLFVKDADIIGIVRKSFADRISSDNYWENAMEGDYIASYDENELYKIVRGFMDNEDKDFMFSPTMIYIYFNNSGTNFKMIDIADSISIYTKYLTDENIYENSNIGRKNIFTLVDARYDIFDLIDYGYLEDNFWYDVSFGGMYLPDNTLGGDKLAKIRELEESIISESYLKIEEYREEAKSNSDKFYMLFLSPNVGIYNDSYYTDEGWIYSYSNMAITRIYEKIYEMPIEVYENTYRDKLIDAYRYEYFVLAGGAQLIPESGDGATFKEETNERVYDYVNSIQLTKLSEIFYDDSDYMEVIEMNVKDYLKFEYEYNDEEITNLVKNMKCDLVGNHIEVTIPEIEEFKREITFYEFPKEMIKVFDKEENI